MLLLAFVGTLDWGALKRRRKVEVESEYKFR